MKRFSANKYLMQVLMCAKIEGIKIVDVAKNEWNGVERTILMFEFPGNEGGLVHRLNEAFKIKDDSVRMNNEEFEKGKAIRKELLKQYYDNKEDGEFDE